MRPDLSWDSRTISRGPKADVVARLPRCGRTSSRTSLRRCVVDRISTVIASLPGQFLIGHRLSGAHCSLNPTMIVAKMGSVGRMAGDPR